MIKEDVLNGEKIKIGLSACLSGDEVRYNAQGAEDKFVTQQMSAYFSYVKVCPEMAIGMGTPRETIRIVSTDDGVRLRNREGSNDYTDKMREFSSRSAQELEEERLCGFIFKKGSPSCGAYRVKVYRETGETINNSEIGFYSRAVQEKYPFLPVEEDGRLNDPGLRHNFIVRVFAYRRWQMMVEDNMSINSLVAFHQKHKYMLMSYSQEGLRELGNLVANKEKRDVAEVCHEYIEKFSELTKKPASRAKHTNVLSHLFGYFSKYLDDFDRQETVAVIEKYRTGLLPLVLPISRISHYVRKYEIKYLLGQSYLVYPEELGILNKL